MKKAEMEVSQMWKIILILILLVILIVIISQAWGAIQELLFK